MDLIDITLSGVEVDELVQLEVLHERAEVEVAVDTQVVFTHRS